MEQSIPITCRGCKYSKIRKMKNKITREISAIKLCNYMDSVAKMQAIADRENAMANKKIAPFNVRCGFRKEAYD